MKLIIQQNRIAGTATDDYSGPDAFITAPSDYDPGKQYTVRAGAIVLPTLAENKATWTQAIDAAVLAIYAKPTSLADEYKAREADSVAYKAAGYTGTVPARVAGFATPAGMTPKAATDLILSQAAQFKTALAQLADLRMQKYAVARAATEAEALAVYSSAMTAIAAIAAALG